MDRVQAGARVFEEIRASIRNLNGGGLLLLSTWYDSDLIVDKRYQMKPISRDIRNYQTSSKDSGGKRLVSHRISWSSGRPNVRHRSAYSRSGRKKMKKRQRPVLRAGFAFVVLGGCLAISGCSDPFRSLPSSPASPLTTKAALNLEKPPADRARLLVFNGGRIDGSGAYRPRNYSIRLSVNEVRIGSMKSGRGDGLRCGAGPVHARVGAARRQGPSAEDRTGHPNSERGRVVASSDRCRRLHTQDRSGIRTDADRNRPPIRSSADQSRY